MHQFNPTEFAFADHIEHAKAVARNHGPDIDAFDQHRAWYTALNQQIETGKLSEDQRNRIRDEFGEAYSVKTLQGHVFQQPMGYPGDYLLIDKIYDSKVSDDPRFRRYDQFFQSQHAAVAVRNRKLYFKELIRSAVERFQEPIRILNLACGPCRDIVELLQESPSIPASFVCVDVDDQALNFAKAQLVGHAGRVTFELDNILRFKPSAEPFHLIWSAGLFDYFNDRIFSRVLSRYLPALRSEGELVVGNFGDNNPTRGSMEALANWYLHHRTDQKLKSLAKTASGFDESKITVGYEPTGVNRFLHIRNSTAEIRWDLPHLGPKGPKWLAVAEAHGESEQHE